MIQNVKEFLEERKLGLRRKIRKRRSTMSRGLAWLPEHFQIKTILDVGASNGCWSWLCMKFFPEADYILYEPQPLHSEALDKFANHCNQKIIPVKKAVGERKGTSYFDASSTFGGAIANEEKSGTIRVDVTTIDCSVAELQVGGPFLLKLDTHGFEREILEGAKETLSECEILIIEAYNYYIQKDSFTFWELCNYLVKLGFRPIDLVDVGYRKYDNSMWQMDIFFAKSTWPGFSYTSYK